MSGIISGAKKSLPVSRTAKVGFDKQPILKENLTSDFSHLERRFLAGILENSNHCIRPTSTKSTGHEAVYRPSKLSVATISLSLRFDDGDPATSHYEFVDNTPYKHLTYSDRLSIDDFEGLVLGSIEHAFQGWRDDDGHDDGSSKLIVLNEFGFPFFRQDKKRDSFANHVSDLATKNNAHVLCGTSHCFRRKQNIAFLAQPRSQEPLEHPKYSPALSLGENLAPRSDLNWRYYKTELGQMAVLVCFDAIDPNVILRQIYFYRDVPADNRINIYLIPSFSPNDVVRDQAEMLSYFTNSIVVYVNYQYPYFHEFPDSPSIDDIWQRSHGVFVCGEDITGAAAISKSRFAEFVNDFNESVFSTSSSDTTLWSSVTSWQLSYSKLLRQQRSLPSRFSPLMEEIFSLAKPDPGLQKS